MRTTFFVSTLLVVFAGVVRVGAHPQQSVVSLAGTSINYSARKSNTRFEIQTRGKRYRLALSRDPTVAPAAKPSRVQFVGEIEGAAIIVTDTYPSRAGGMSYCQAGEETFLRVISLSPRRPRETLRVKLESCRQNLELDAEGVEWLGASSLLRIHWLAGPGTKGTPEVRTIRIGPYGKPARVSIPSPRVGIDSETSSPRNTTRATNPTGPGGRVSHRVLAASYQGDPPSFFAFPRRRRQLQCLIRS